ncbi:hypothetical protein RRG08_053221, partial [Elysia crispata]
SRRRHQSQVGGRRPGQESPIKSYYIIYGLELFIQSHKLEIPAGDGRP